MLEIKHGFLHRCHDIVDLFEGVDKLSAFKYRLEKQSLIDPLRYDSQKYVGDGFEMFVEIFLKTAAYDNRVGISEYEPVQSDDNGVDGVGYNIVGEKCAIQVKFRSNTNTLLTADGDHLANLISDALLKYDIQQSKDKEPPKHYIITTAKGLHRYTDTEFFKGKVKCYGYDDLRSFLDGNKSFWDLCRKIAENEVNKIEKGA